MIFQKLFKRHRIANNPVLELQILLALLLTAVFPLHEPRPVGGGGEEGHRGIQNKGRGMGIKGIGAGHRPQLSRPPDAEDPAGENPMVGK